MEKVETEKHVLVGNSFPLSLMRAVEVVVRQGSVEELRRSLEDARIHSFWGHGNTRSVAETVLGVSLEPTSERPALILSEKQLPVLDGEIFDTCWILSPDYPKGFRPAIGQEVEPEMISGWHVLKLIWKGK